MNRRIALVLTSILLAFSILVGCSKENDQLEVPSKNVTVIDGNTLQIKGSKKKVETVKLISIETPSDHQPYSEEARVFLENLIKNSKNITLEKGPVTKNSKSDHMLVYITVNDKSVQEEMLKNGYARVSNVDPPLDEYAKAYQTYEQGAKQRKLNIWSLPNYVKADGFHPEAIPTLIVASVNSDVYHKVTCKDVEKIQEQNKVYFKTEEEAKASGRTRSQTPGCWK